MRLFISDDGNSFFALSGDEIASFGSVAHRSSAVIALLQLATELGGRRISAFDTVDPFAFGTSGFRAVSREAFDDEKAPLGWNEFGEFKRFNQGRPDIVYMIWDPSKPTAYRPGDGQMFTGANADLEAEKFQIESAKQLSTTYKRKASQGGSALRYYDPQTYKSVVLRLRQLEREMDDDR